MGYQCSVCEQEPAAILITPLTGGETVPIGADCIPIGMCAFIGAATGVDADQLYDYVRELQNPTETAPGDTKNDGQAETDTKPPATKPRARRAAADVKPNGGTE